MDREDREDREDERPIQNPDEDVPFIDEVSENG
jgi:hypothetical protein